MLCMFIQAGSIVSKTLKSCWNCQHFVVICAHVTIFLRKIIILHTLAFIQNNETVTCMCGGCSIQTNIHGTFYSHKKQKHKPCTLKDFKSGVVQITQVSQQSPEDSSNQDDTAVEDSVCLTSDVSQTPNLTQIIEQNFTSALLKLEHFAHVPGTKMHEFWN